MKKMATNINLKKKINIQKQKFSSQKHREIHKSKNFCEFALT